MYFRKQKNIVDAVTVVVCECMHVCSQFVFKVSCAK